MISKNELHCIAVHDYYDNTEMYRFITPAIFDALEAAFLAGEPTAMIPEHEFIKMSHRIILNNGIENS
jgi:hypothetical protein